MLVDRKQLTSGSTFHSAGLVGQLRGSVSLTRMMMDSVELYRTLDCGWVECGGLRLASVRARWEETRRQAGWAKTFGLPLELLSRRGGAGALPAHDHRRRARRLVAADRRLPRPEPAHLRARRGRARGRLRHPHQHARDRRSTSRGGRVRGVQTDRGDIEAEVVVNAGGMFAAEIGRMAGVRVPLVPMAHEYLVTQPFRDRDADEHAPDHARPRPPRLLPRGRRRARDGRLRAPLRRRGRSTTRGVDAIPADFNGRLLEEDWDRFEEITVNARQRVPVMDEVTITKLINGPEAFTPDGEFLLGESARARLLRRRRLLRPRARGRGRDGQADGGVDRRGRAVARRLGDGHPPLRRALPLARLHAQAHARGLRDLLRHQVPRPRARGRAPAARLAGLRLARRATAPRSGRSRAGSGSTGTRPTRRRATRRCARAAGPGSTGRPRSAPSTPPRARPPRCSTRPRSRSWRSAGPGAAELLESPVRQPRRPRPGQGHLHADAQPPRRHRVRLHGHPARRRPLLDRHRHRVRHPRPRLDRLPRRRRTCSSRTSPRAGPASACGARAPATSSPPARPTRSTSAT